MPIPAGRLRHRIAFRRPSEIEDGKGGYTTAWATIATVSAEVVGLAGREAVMEHVLQGVSVYRIRIRWRSGVLASDQVVLADGTQLNIRSATDPDGRRRQLVIIADTAAVRRDD